MSIIRDSGTQGLRLFLRRIKKLLFSPITSIRKIYRYTLNTKCRHVFHNRSRHSKTLVLVLAGYKPAVWDDVFARIKLFAPQDADVCLVSSGIYSEKLAQIAEQYSWSYASTKRNCLPLALNIGIILHPEAEFIYKIDEDIFVTKHLFETLAKTYEQVKSDGMYEPGFIAPIIPVNVWGHMRILDKLGLLDVYEQRFGKTGLLPFNRLDVWRNPEVAKFFWGDGGILPQLDELAEKFYQDKFEYKACPIRFSVGCMYFNRDLWQKNWGFNVPFRGIGMGGEEVQMCCWAMIRLVSSYSLREYCCWPFVVRASE